MIAYEVSAAEDFADALKEAAGEAAMAGFTNEQMMSLSQMLHAADCTLNAEGIRAIQYLEIDGLYPAMLIPVDDARLLASNSLPFPEATPFGVEPREWAENPPAIHSYTFVHSTDYQSAAEIIREGQLRPTSVPPSSQEPACVLYGASTPRPPSDYTLQVCVSQLLKKPKGRQDVMFLGEFRGTQSHYKSSWGSLSDECYIVRRRGIIRTSDRWGCYPGHFWVKALVVVGYNR